VDRDGEKQMKTYFKPIWLVEIKFPKRFINSVNSQKLSVEENNTAKLASQNNNNDQPQDIGDSGNTDNPPDSDANNAADDILKDLK
jgi:hypothetical protein